MATIINFGPTQPPTDTMDLGPHEDQMTVMEDTGEVAHTLATANGSWPQLTQDMSGRGTRPVFVNPASVRFVIEKPS